MTLDSDILDAIEKIAKRIARKHWSESPADLVQDGIVLVLELYRKKPNADKEWIYKALHNFYATKSKKMRRYEYRRVDSDRAPEQSVLPDVDDIELDNLDLEMIRYLLDQGMSKSDIMKHLKLSDRTLYAKLRKARDANS